MLTCRTTCSPKPGKTEATERYWVSPWGVWDKKERNGEGKTEKKGRQCCHMDKRSEKEHRAELPGVWTFLLPLGQLPLHSPRFKPLNRDWGDVMEAKEKAFRKPEMELTLTLGVSWGRYGRGNSSTAKNHTWISYESEEGPLGGLPTEPMKKKTLEHVPVIMA